MTAKNSTYTDKKGTAHPTLELHKSAEGDKFPFTFGVEKSKLILSHLVEIQRFVAANSVAAVADKTPAKKATPTFSFK